MDEINDYKNLLNDTEIIINKFKSINEILKIYYASVNKLYQKNLKEKYEFEKINSFFLNSQNKDKILLNANSDNFLEEKILNYFKENFDQFVKFFEDELSKEELLNK